jgi:Tol biopolymer transport system component
VLDGIRYADPGRERSIVVSVWSHRASSARSRVAIAFFVLTFLPSTVGLSPAFALTDIFPSAVTVEVGTLISGNAASLAADDDSYLVVRSTKPGTKTATWYGTFTGVDDAVTSLTVTYKGKSSVTCTQVTLIWRWTDSTWVQLDSRSVGATEIEVADLVPPGGLADYVSGSSGPGDVRVRITCSNTTGQFQLSGDLLKLEVDTGAPTTHTLTVTRAGSGQGTVTSTPTGIDCGADCSESYAEGTVVTLTPLPDGSSVFAGWSGACTGTGPCQVSMGADASVTATFDSSAVTLVSVSSAGLQGNDHSDTSAVSNDGRYVAFSSDASSLVDDDINVVRDVFVRDRMSGATMLASVSSSESAGNGPSDNPALAGDGAAVAFQSDATNLVTADTNVATDVFLRDPQTGATTRESVSSTGVEGNGPSEYPTVSADGRYVAFVSAATNLVPGDTNGVADVFVRDRLTGTTTLVSVSSSGAQGDGPVAQEPPAISPDGRYIAFSSAATNLVADDGNGVRDVFLHDRTTGLTVRVSVSTFGREGNGPSDDPGVSADGSIVAFASNATNLVPNDFNATTDVFVYEVVPARTSRVSVATAGEPNGGSSAPVITSDGMEIVFQSSASNLVPSDTNQAPDVFIYDRDTGTSERVSVSGDGTQASGPSSSPAMSGDGRYVTYSSDAADLLPADANSKRDVFHRDRGAPPASPLVVLVEPVEGSRVFDVQPLTATVDPSFPTNRVDFVVDGVVRASDSTAPYQVSWNTSEVADGDRVILARAVAADDSMIESVAVMVTVTNAATCDDKLQLDHEAAVIGVDDYVRWGMYCMFVPDLLAGRYDSPAPIPNRQSAYLRVFRHWDQVSQATRDELEGFFADYNSGAYLEPLPLRADSHGGSTEPQTTLVDLLEDCDVDYKWCEYLTANGRWLFEYATEDYEGGVPLLDANENGIRDDIDELAASLNHAYVTYAGLGYLTPSAEPIHVVLRKYTWLVDEGTSVTPAPGAPGDADIYLDYPDVDLTANPMHELFHMFQYEYFDGSVLDYCCRFGTSFWMEATAEWALHKATNTYTALMDDDDEDDYADDLPEFLADPNVEIDASASWWRRGDHEYGAFILAEYLEAVTSTDFIRQTWARVGEGSGLGALEAVDEVLIQNWGVSLGDLLPSFWRRAYRLSATDDPNGFVSADFPGEPVDLWRFLLNNPDFTTFPENDPYTNPYAGARAERQVFLLDGTTTATGEIDRLARGGAAFIEFVHDLGPGTLDIELKNFSNALWDIPSADDVRLSVYSFAAYPDQLCQTPVLDVPLQSNGVASVSIPMDASCVFSTLFISHASLDGGDKSQMFVGHYTTFPLRTNNAEGGTDEVVVTEANSGGASGDAFWSTSGVRFDDDGPVTDGALSFRFDGSYGEMSWYTFEETLPPKFTTVFRMYLNDYPSVGAPGFGYLLQEVFFGYANDSVDVNLDTDGFLHLTVWEEFGGDTPVSLDAPVPTGQWVRVEVDVLAGAARIRLYDAPHGGTLLASATAVVADFGPENEGRDTVLSFFVWPQDGETVVSPVWMDELAVLAS